MCSRALGPRKTRQELESIVQRVKDFVGQTSGLEGVEDLMGDGAAGADDDIGGFDVQKMLGLVREMAEGMDGQLRGGGGGGGGGGAATGAARGEDDDEDEDPDFYAMGEEEGEDAGEDESEAREYQRAMDSELGRDSDLKCALPPAAGHHVLRVGQKPACLFARA